MKHRYPIRLLIADERPAEAAALIAALRRASYLVNPKLVRGIEDLREAVGEARWDLVLMSGTLPGAPLAECLETASAARGGAPLVVLDDPSSDRRAVMLEALALGARDVVDRCDGEMLQYTVQREVEALEHRRTLRRYRKTRRGAFDTMRWFVDAAREPLAVIQGADIHFANGRFLDLFGLHESELPLRGGLLGCVSDEEREALRAFLDDLEPGDDRTAEVELEATHRDGRRFELRVELGSMVLDGRPVQRLLVAGPAARAGAPPATAPAAEPAQPPAATPMRTPPASSERPALAVIDGGAARPGDAVARRDGAALERETLLEEVDAARSRPLAEGSLHCLLYVEIDNHESLRRLLGPERLTVLIGEIRALLAAALPGDAVPRRIADDGFAALVSGPTRDDAMAMHAAVERAIGGALVEVGDKTVLVSASAGLARVKPEDDDAQAPLERAYRACQSEISIAPGILEGPPEAATPPDEDEEALAGLAADLDAAMSDGRLWLVYQPIVALRGEPIELYETFLRFRARDGQMVPPPTFLAAAEKAGMLAEIDLWLVNRAIDALAEQQRTGRRTHIQIKLTHHSVQDVRIPIAVGRRIKSERIAPRRLIIETSETIATAQVKATRALMHAAHGFDCATALEHFGVCRRPFKLLEHLPVDYLTIDSSLVNALGSDAAAMRRTARIVERARGLGKKTVAEYVEDPQSIARLYDTGIDFVQGNYIQPATESLDFEFSMMVG